MVGAEESHDTKWTIVWICATIASAVAFLILLDPGAQGLSTDPIRANIPAHSSSSITLTYAGRDVTGIAALFPGTTEQRIAEECPSGIGDSGRKISLNASKTTTTHIFRFDVDGHEFCISKGEDFEIEGLTIRLVELTGQQVCEPPDTPNPDKWCPTLAEIALGRADQRWLATGTLAATTGFGVALTKTFDYIGLVRRRRARAPEPAKAAGPSVIGASLKS